LDRRIGTIQLGFGFEEVDEKEEKELKTEFGREGPGQL